MTKHRPKMNAIHWGGEESFIDLASATSSFEVNDEDTEQRRRKQLAYLARYAPGLIQLITDDMPVHELDAWSIAVSDIVTEENAKE